MRHTQRAWIKSTQYAELGWNMYTHFQSLCFVLVVFAATTASANTLHVVQMAGHASLIGLVVYIHICLNSALGSWIPWITAFHATHGARLRPWLTLLCNLFGLPSPMTPPSETEMDEEDQDQDAVEGQGDTDSTDADNEELND
jgi:hypothetical protein